MNADDDLEPDDVVDNVYTENRVKRITVNETVAATTAGSRAVHRAAEDAGIQTFLIWRLGTCNHCQVCPLLDRTDQSFWGDVTTGPPIHPHCCCYTTVEFGTRTSLFAGGCCVLAFPQRLNSSRQIARAVGDCDDTAMK